MRAGAVETSPVLGSKALPQLQTLTWPSPGPTKMNKIYTRCLISASLDGLNENEGNRNTEGRKGNRPVERGQLIEKWDLRRSHMRKREVT